MFEKNKNLFHWTRSKTNIFIEQKKLFPAIINTRKWIYEYGISVYDMFLTSRYVWFWSNENHPIHTKDQPTQSIKKKLILFYTLEQNQYIYITETIITQLTTEVIKTYLTACNQSLKKHLAPVLIWKFSMYKKTVHIIKI